MEPLSLNAVEALPPGLLAHDNTFVRYGVHGDGSCFFHSMCAALNKDNYLMASAEEQSRIGQQFRFSFSKTHCSPERWAAFLVDNPKYNISHADVVTNFCDPRFWANEHMIKFVSKVLQLNVLFFDAEKASMFCGVHGGKNDPMILIMWVKRSHFEPIGVLRTKRADSCGVQFMFDPTEDKAVVDGVVSRYQRKCRV